MPKKRVDARINDYNRLINRDKDRVEEGRPYQTFLVALSELVKRTEELYKPAENGQMKPMTPEQYENLMTVYKDVQKACRAYKKDEWVKDKIEQSRERIVNRIQNYIEKDMAVLEKLDQKHLPSLPDVIKKTRTVQADLTGKKLDMVGGAQSRRIALTSAKGTKGFFTEKSGYDKQKDWEKLVDSLADEVPERYKKDFESLRNDEKKRDAIMKISRRKGEFETDDVANHLKALQDIMTGQQESEYYDAYDMDDLEDEEIDDMEKMQEVLKKLSIESNAISTKGGFMVSAGIQSTGRLDQRNSAMTTIAELLGNSRLLARSVPMAVIKDGKIMEGTFMESVQGVDVNNMGPEDMYLKDCSLDAIGTPQILKQLAELQVLDYICGNIDRHRGNMIYHFEKRQDGKPYLSKITGIDNDSSFGIKTFESHAKTGAFGGLENMAAISSRQYRVIRNLNEDVLKEALLPYEFTEKEIKAVWERVGWLKLEIKKKHIEVVSDKEWENKSLQSLSKGENIFATVGKLPGIINDKLERVQKNNIHQKRQIEFAEGDKVKGLYRLDLEKSHESLMKLVKGIRDADDNLYINSSAFRKMRNTAYELGKFSQDMMKRYPEGNMKISAEDQKKLNELYEKMGQTSQEYIDAKKLSPKTDHGKLRLDLAKDLRDLSADSCDLLEQDEPQMDEPQREEPQLDEGNEL